MIRTSARVRDAAVVFAVAMLVRVLFLFSTSDHAWPHSVLYEGDAPVWARWAQALDRGQPFEFDLPMRTPGVAFALHWLAPGVLAAPFFTVLKLLWCALSAATCALLFAIVEREVSAREAWIASLLLCFAFGSYELATSLNNEAPYAFLLVLLVGATLRWIEAPRAALAAAIGILHGVAMLLRAEHALLLAAFLAYGAIVARNWRSTSLITIAAVAVCLPWSWRGHVATERFDTVESEPIDFARARPPWSSDAQEFLRALPAFARQGNFAVIQALHGSRPDVPIERADVERYFREKFGYVPEPLSTWTLVSSKGALDFALANHPESDGGFSLAGLRDALGADPQLAFGRPSHLKLYNHGYEVGWSAIRADFGAWTKLVGKKLERFFDGAMLGVTALDFPHGRASRRAPVDLATPLERNFAWSLGLTLAILAGILLSRRRNLAALCLIVLAYKLAITIAYYGYARQAVSIEPVLYFFAAVAVDAALARVRCPTRVAVAVGVALVCAMLACDVVAFRGANAFDIRAANPQAIRPAPEWGAEAFETIESLEIVPR